MNWLKKIHVAAIVSAAVTVVGIVSEPAVLHLLPASAATIVTAVGAILQAVTKGVQHGNTELVDRDTGF